MKHIKFLALIVLTVLFLNDLQAQKSATVGLTEEPVDGTVKKRDVFDNSGLWTLGFGLDIIDDGRTQNVFRIYNSELSHFSNPIALSLEYGVSNSFSLVGRLSLNKFRAGKRVKTNVLSGAHEPMYFALDATPKYSFRKLLNRGGLDPYIMAGPGYLRIENYATTASTTVPTVNHFTFNAVVGMNYRISEDWGVGVDGLGRFGLKDGKNDAFIHSMTQLTFSVHYRLPEARYASYWR